MVTNKRYKRRAMKPEELELAAYFEWIRMYYHSALAYHVPNEGRRAKHIAKRIGILAGLPDIYVDEARGGYLGLRIEMKRTDKKSRVQPTQTAMISAMVERGYACYIAWGWEEAMLQTIAYMTLQRPIR